MLLDEHDHHQQYIHRCDEHDHHQQYIYRCAGRRRKYPDGTPYCEHESPSRWRGPCPSCGGFYDCERMNTNGSKTSDYTTAADMPGAKKVYIPSGVENFDLAIGGGLVRGSLILFGGVEGIGKTSLMLMVCDGIARKTGRPVLYASGEETKEALINTCQRLHIVNDKLILEGEQTNIFDIMRMCEKLSPFLTVLDSGQVITLDGDVGHSRSAEMEAVMQLLNRYCKKKKVCGVVINQMNTSLELKGGTGGRHACETVLRFYEYDGKQDGDPRTIFGRAALSKMDLDADGDPKNVRTLWTGKNRNGEMNKKVFFEMTNEGLLVGLKQKPPRTLHLVGDEGDDEDGGED